MRKNQIIRELAKRTGFSITDVTEVYGAFIELIEEKVWKNECMRIGIIDIGVKDIPDRHKFDNFSKRHFIKPAHLFPSVKFIPYFKTRYYNYQKEKEANIDSE